MLLDNWTLKDQVSRGTEWGVGARTEMDGVADPRDIWDT